MPRIVEKELSYKITSLCFEAQHELGRFCRERQYGDALAKKLESAALKFTREFPVKVADRKSNLIDFIVEGRMALELKVKPFITKEDYIQLQRYLRSANLELGLIVNFGQLHLKPKRVLNSFFYSDHSDGFVVSDRTFNV